MGEESSGTSAEGHAIGGVMNEPGPQVRSSEMPESGGKPLKNALSTSRLRFCILALSMCHIVSFIDQMGVSTALPALAAQLETGTSTSWIGASFLIATTVLQLLHGRLSEVFGRKSLLFLCLLLLGVGDLACGFAQTREQLFAFRAVAGVGAGGVNSLVMVIVSDITTNGQYQGVLGLVVALSNAVGPVLGGAIVDAVGWRWVFWVISILAIPTAALVQFCLPSRQWAEDIVDKMKKIDFGGMILNLASTVLLLVPFAGGGVDYAWSAPFFIITVTIALILVLVLVVYEWKVAKLPAVPFRLFRVPYCWALYLQALFTGCSYFGNFSYLPLYFQTILGYSAVESGALILTIVVPTTIASFLSGQYIARRGEYLYCILFGFVFRVSGNALTLLFSRHTTLEPLIAILLVEGLGIGFTLQPILMGLYANNKSVDRGATTSLRNYIRTIGGASGLIISGAILSNILNRDLYDAGIITKDEITSLTSSTYLLPGTTLPTDEKEQILDVYMKGLHYVFAYHTACSGLCLILTWWIGRTSLRPLKATEGEKSEGAAPKAQNQGKPDKDMERLLTQLRNGRLT